MLLSKWHIIVNIVKNGNRILSLKVFKRNIKIFENKPVPQYAYFRCGMTHNKTSLRKIGTTYGLQRNLLKKSNHYVVFEDTWQNETEKWLDCEKTTFCVLVLAILDRVQGRKKIQDME